MLQLFTKRQFNAGILLIFLVFIGLQFFSIPQNTAIEAWKPSAPLALGILDLLGEDLLSNHFFAFLISTLLISFQLVLVYRILSKIRNLEKYNLLLTWIYCWLIHLFPAWNSLSPALLASTILLFVFYRIYTLVDIQKNNFLFNVSSLLGVSFLLWYPTILLLPFIAILLFQYNAINFKKISILILSFSIPIIWFCLYYLFQGKGEQLFYKFSTFHVSALHYESIDSIQLIPIVLILLYAIIGFLEAWSLSNKTAKMSRLFINSLFVLVFFLSLGFILSIDDILYSFLFLAFPMSLFIVLFINNFKQERHAEIAHIILLLAIMFNFVYQYLEF